MLNTRAYTRWLEGFVKLAEANGLSRDETKDLVKIAQRCMLENRHPDKYAVAYGSTVKTAQAALGPKGDVPEITPEEVMPASSQIGSRGLPFGNPFDTAVTSFMPSIPDAAVASAPPKDSLRDLYSRFMNWWRPAEDKAAPATPAGPPPPSPGVVPPPVVTPTPPADATKSDPAAPEAPAPEPDAATGSLAAQDTYADMERRLAEQAKQLDALKANQLVMDPEKLQDMKISDFMNYMKQLENARMQLYRAVPRNIPYFYSSAGGPVFGANMPFEPYAARSPWGGAYYGTMGGYSPWQYK